MNMSRSARYLAVITLPVAALFVATFSQTTIVERASSSATSTSVVALSIATSSPATTRVATSSPKKVPVASAKKQTAPNTSVVISAEPSAPPMPQPAAPTQAEFDAAAAALRGALVNILCYAPAGSGLHSISGSGVFIDPKGIILTNAHVAQHFLLADRGVTCTIRTGSPATDAYQAEPIYVSSSWINANPKVLSEQTSTGTGEYDFSLLAVTKSETSAALPATFPFVPLADHPSYPNTPVVIASYGAQFLESNQIQSYLFPTIVFGSVKDVFTFATSSIDVLSLGGTIAAQEGSSGGGVADASGALVGTITTSTVTGTTDTRSLSAITASCIRAEYEQETSKSIDLLLAEPTPVSINDFKPQIAKLEAVITANLP